MQPESSDGFASVGTILPEEGAALLPGGSFRFWSLKRRRVDPEVRKHGTDHYQCRNDDRCQQAGPEAHPAEWNKNVALTAGKVDPDLVRQHRADCRCQNEPPGPYNRNPVRNLKRQCEFHAENPRPVRMPQKSSRRQAQSSFTETRHNDTI